MGLLLIMRYYIFVPEIETASETDLDEDTTLTEEEGFFAVFTCEDIEFDFVMEKLKDLALRGKIQEFLVLDEFTIKDAVPVQELFKADREEDVEYLEGLIKL